MSLAEHASAPIRRRQARRQAYDWLKALLAEVKP
jgi:hypothetical protein